MQYKVRISPRAKRITLRFQSGQVIISSPKKISPNKAKQLLVENKEWIDDRISEFSKLKKYFINLSDGNTVSVVGKQIKIQWLQTQGSAKSNLSNEDLTVFAAEGSHHSETVNFLRDHAKQVLRTRTRAYARSYGFDELNKVVIKDQSTRWGSCSTNNNINLNWRLVFAPVHVMDYVIIHELAHLKQMNHSADFWRIVEDIMPDYKKHRRWLKKYGQGLQIIQPE